MESAQLQLVFNVIAITSVTSFAGSWYLLRKDRKLATARQAAENNPAPTERDIRQFAANRRTKWVSGVAAAMCSDDPNRSLTGTRNGSLGIVGN
jgi:hypothetical protein